MKKKIKIEKSRILLKQALIHLLLEKSYTSISIQELCKEAKVGRQVEFDPPHLAVADIQRLIGDGALTPRSDADIAEFNEVGHVAVEGIDADDAAAADAALIA